MDGICPEVIKVYIFKADPGEDDIGGTVDIVESESDNDHGETLINQNSSVRIPREKMVYMTVNDSQHDDEDLSKYVTFIWGKKFKGFKKYTKHTLHVSSIRCC
uniref:Transcriptional activator Zfx/Zfy domain-containing protein n=2 Tax=Micrurus paraensis TaxID=1970185 RepID=A0A2D4KE34_9SAUR